MFDSNKFKRAVKEWIRSNPDGTLESLGDYCEELIPPAQFAANKRIVDQTLSWYSHILTHRDTQNDLHDEDEDDVRYGSVAN